MRHNRLYVANTSSTLSRIFGRSPWPDWSNRLKSVEGAAVEQVQRFYAPHRARAVSVPLGMLLGDDDEGDSDYA
jgi:hypothetical protein